MTPGLHDAELAHGATVVDPAGLVRGSTDDSGVVPS